MKIKTTLFCILFILITTVSTSTAQIQIGAKLGLNSTTLSSNNFNIEDITRDSLDLYFHEFTEFTETKYKFGLHAGAYAVFDFGMIKIVAEALWSMKGAKNFGLNRNGNPSDIELHYLSIPILANIDITDKLTIQAGPQVGIILNARQKTGRGGAANLDGRITEDGDLSGIIGLKFQILNIGHLTARYELGLNPAFYLLTNQGERFEFNNRSFQIGFGIPLFSLSARLQP